MATNYPGTIDSPTTKTDNVDNVMAADINNVQDAVVALETKVGIDSSAITTSLDYKVNNFFATGRKVYLYENTAPTGWSIVAVTDSVLAVKGGTNAYNVNGGNAGGTWTISGITGGSHALSIAELAAHTHSTLAGATGNPAGNYASLTTAVYNYGINVSESTGSGAAHSHGASTHAGTWRPAAAVGIIVTKT